MSVHAAPAGDDGALPDEENAWDVRVPELLCPLRPPSVRRYAMLWESSPSPAQA
jgi:hypothetical protein